LRKGWTKRATYSFKDRDDLLVALVGNLVSYLRVKLEIESVTPTPLFALIVKIKKIDLRRPCFHKCDVLRLPFFWLICYLF
jgi:hypothetical protein